MCYDLITEKELESKGDSGSSQPAAAVTQESVLVPGTREAGGGGGGRGVWGAGSKQTLKRFRK